MTQSGQGEEPSRRPAREGIVLPSDGGEPLLPGSVGEPAPPPHRPVPPATPAGGQAWDRPWGPEDQRGAAGWDAPAPDAWSARGPGPLPPEGAGTHGGPQGYGTPPQTYGQPSYPQPPADEGATQFLPPVAEGSAPYQQPPAAYEGATQYLPPVPAAPADEGATQYIPPVPAPDEGATQYIPPVAPGALPPEQGSEDTRYLGRARSAGPARPGPMPPPATGPDAQATQYIPPVPPAAGEADRQPPAEFDNLFRGAPAAEGGSTQQMPVVAEPPAPRPGYAPQGPGGGGGGRRRAGHDGGGRTGSRVPLLAAVGIGIVVVGIGAGALMAGGDGEEEDGGNRTVSATAPATDTSASASPTVDPARQQAVELDKLLADSGSSRTAVINAVADVKSCDNLEQAAEDLRDAAGQRTQLVTRLSQLSMDKLPNHAELATALTKAWQASASADNHYAAWADQVAGKKGCHKGQARTTGEVQAATRASGTASSEKAKAASLWNAIAKKYGLTERQPVQL
ncbi:hypothetical protein [Streptomyces fumanus]|uniref:hypothetical protein n=1 Tax=Streptomyces fumanus TaxID=67302 RepID=UPI0033F0484D